ncbi:hypothetical protein [Paenibacillus tepidiphilus]|uniref:hypothetical protein n=1 Tax=Paenibacillus tepidiphilus TaxID=2608683 RepID=UPI00123985DD|nr:hypothetical protein [Paenibacillus tepidiphilus]
MNFGTCIVDSRLLILEFNSSNPEDMGTLVLSLPEADSVDVRSYRASMFDDAEDVMKFIHDNRERTKRNYNYYFQVHAYKIIREHYIQLYYTSHVSNS